MNLLYSLILYFVFAFTSKDNTLNIQYSIRQSDIIEIDKTERSTLNYLLIKIYDDCLYLYNKTDLTPLKVINLNDPLEKIIIQCLLSIKSQYEIVLIENKGNSLDKAAHIGNILKCLQHFMVLSSEDIIYVNKYELIQKLYLIRLVDFLWDLAQSDSTGLLQDFTAPVMGKGCFTDWLIEGLNYEIIYDFLYERLITNLEYILFNRFEINEIPSIFNSDKPKDLKILEIINYIYDLKENNIEELEKDFFISDLRHIKITDNTKLLEFVTLGIVSVSNMTLSVNEQRIFNDLVFVKGEKLIFVQAKSTFINPGVKKDIKNLYCTVTDTILQIEDKISRKRQDLNKVGPYITSDDCTFEDGSFVLSHLERRIVLDFKREAKKLTNRNIETLRALIKIGKANNKDKYILKAINNKDTAILYKIILKIMEFTSVFPRFDGNNKILNIPDLAFDQQIMKLVHAKKIRYLKSTGIYKYYNCMNYININEKEKVNFVLTKLLKNQREELRKIHLDNVSLQAISSMAVSRNIFENPLVQLQTIKKVEEELVINGGCCFAITATIISNGLEIN